MSNIISMRIVSSNVGNRNLHRVGVSMQAFTTSFELTTMECFPKHGALLRMRLFIMKIGILVISECCGITTAEKSLCRL